MKVIQMPPVHAANLVANSSNTAYGVDVIGRVKDDFVFAPSEWETTLQCNVVSHWLGACTTSSMHVITDLQHTSSPYHTTLWCQK